MKLLLVRVYGNDNETIGILSIDNKANCFTLEDTYQTKKVYGKTRIPEGTYRIKLRTSGRLHEKYSKLFPDMHKGMLELQNVPGFTFIYIHIGTTEDDTLGCLLTGRNVNLKNDRFKLTESTEAYKDFYSKVINNIEDLTIQIV